MPPRVVNAGDAGTGFSSWFESLPPITRAWGTAIMVTTIGFRLGLINPRWFFLSWQLIFTRLEVGACVWGVCVVCGEGGRRVCRAAFVYAV
jgi:hypothetical protein